MSSRIIEALASVPPLRPATIVPIVVMVSLWTMCVQAGGSPERAFVTVMVLGQSFAIWRSLPRAAHALSRPGRDRTNMLVWPVVGMVALAAAQIVICEPVFSQRLLSAGCIFVLVVMALGMRRERQVLARVDNRVDARKVPLLRINALVAALTLVVNESLIAAEELVVWVAGMALFAVAVHGLYWFMVLLVLPAEDSHA
ncbi:hypothetical protein [Roseovarius aestuariivivens]|uniref:hypothetical protein n=1 Tax=Roseovarius aestuariivivens TaxID=1888910 RepID=UPI0010809969|nr:hypothetical protein [Roseovarius aestuariivivens]